MLTNKPTQKVFIIVMLALLLSIVVSMADSLVGPTPEEIKNTLVYAGIKNGVTFTSGGQTYIIENITVSKEVGNRYAVRFNTYIP